MAGTTTYQLPAAEPGRNYGFSTGGDRGCEIAASGTDKITYISGQFTSVITPVAFSSGFFIQLTCVRSGEWQPTSVIGEWIWT
jgi:hypothetical protein